MTSPEVEASGQGRGAPGEGVAARRGPGIDPTPDPIRSHFASFDIWHAASDRGKAGGHGWLARLGAELKKVESTLRDLLKTHHQKKIKV